MTAGSVVARKPIPSIRATSSSDRSPTWDCPLLRPSTTAADRSSPATVSDTRQASWARGRPTYPRPTTTRSKDMVVPLLVLVQGFSGVGRLLSDERVVVGDQGALAVDRQAEADGGGAGRQRGRDVVGEIPRRA